MATPYLIRIPSHEREMIESILSSRKCRIPSVWKQLTENNNEIYLSIFENGFVIGALSGQRSAVPVTWKQLIDIMNQIKKDAGVEETDMGNGMVQLKDRSGWTAIRQKLDWEV